MIEVNKLKLLIDKKSDIWYYVPQYNDDDFGSVGQIHISTGKIIYWDNIPRLEFSDSVDNFSGVMPLYNLYENAKEIFDEYIEKIQSRKLFRLLIKPQRVYDKGENNEI